MTQPSYEHIALMQMLDRVESLERTVALMAMANARLSLRVDHLEREAKRCRLGRDLREAQTG
ncbi:MAG: hypothetical protein JXR75_13645 [Rhodobacteraceae bacterium]|nr:hypothetical protein [Paracoccaceae bacterium]